MTGSTKAAVAALVLATIAAGLVTFARPASAEACPTHLVDHGGQVVQPTSIVAAPDGNLWLASQGNSRIARLDPDTGDVETFAVGAPPSRITVGPDGALWFTASNEYLRLGPGAPPPLYRIGRITTAGVVELFSHEHLHDPLGITTGPDGNLWFTNAGNDRIGRLDPDHPSAMTLFEPTKPVAQGGEGADAAGPVDITTGPDGVLWYTAAFAGGLDQQAGVPYGRVVRMDTSGTVLGTYGGNRPRVPLGIVTGPDGHVWTTSFFNARLLRFDATSPATLPTTFTAPDSSYPTVLTAGRPGEDELWFVPDSLPGRIGRISTADGSIATYSAAGNDGASDVEVGPDGNVWFVGQYDDTVGYVDPDDPGPRFADISARHPFCAEIDWMDGEGISTGYVDRTFRPADGVTRQAMSAFLYRLAGSPPFAPGPRSFTDVGAGHPFFLEVEWMAEEDITTGYPDGTYRPAAVVTRQAMSAFMQRLAEPSPPFVGPASPTFPDVGRSHPFYDEVEWMAAEQISTGYADGRFRPAAVVTRQAMSAFMYRLAPLLED